MVALVLPKLKTVSTADNATFNKIFSTYLAGKLEIIYRVEYLKNVMGVDTFKKKTAKDDDDSENVYKSKLTVYSNVGGYSSVEVPIIKELKQYVVFAGYLALNYENGYDNVKSFVDSRYKFLKSKHDFCNNKFRAMKDEVESSAYQYFSNLDETCYSKYFTAQFDSNLTVPSKETFLKCLVVSTAFALIFYAFDKASTFAFSDPKQIIHYLENENDAINSDIVKIYNQTIQNCATPKKGATGKTAASKSKGKTKSKQQVDVDNDDDDIIEEEEDDDEVRI